MTTTGLHYATSKKYTSFQNGVSVLVMTETTYKDGSTEYRRFTWNARDTYEYPTQAAFKKAMARYTKINGAGYVQDDERGYSYVKELDMWYS
jgi:hypothetical protein